MDWYTGRCLRPLVVNMMKLSPALSAVSIVTYSFWFLPPFFVLFIPALVSNIRLKVSFHWKNCFQEFRNGERRRRQRLSSISWEGKSEHKGLKRGFHFYHRPYCVNICMSLLKVFRRWAGHQLLVSCSSSRTSVAPEH